MAESGTGKVCPYCDGKGYVSVPADLPPDDDSRKELSRTTWVRTPCPLCDGKGSISGDDSRPTEGAPLRASDSVIHSLAADISAGSRRFGSSRPSNSPQGVALGGKESWPRICGENRMRQILSDETIGELEKLVSELEAIRHWDTKYRRSRSPERYQTMAFVSRQERRSEIIRQLLRLSTF